MDVTKVFGTHIDRELLLISKEEYERMVRETPYMEDHYFACHVPTSALVEYEVCKAKLFKARKILESNIRYPEVKL